MTEFPVTRWTMIEAAHLDEERRRELLEQFLASYQTPLQRFLMRTRGVGREQAEEIVQAFIVDKVVVDKLLQRADRQRGRLRTFLLRALTNYLLNLRRRDQRHRPLDIVLLDQSGQTQDQSVEPGRVFETEWARYVLERTLQAMRSECVATGRSNMWQVFERRILSPICDGAQPPPYSLLVEELGYEKDSQAMNALITAKRMFTRIMRQVVCEYVSGDEAIDEEIRDLMEIVRHPAHDRIG